MPAMSPTLVMGEEGSTTFEITKAARAFVPLFEIRDLMVVSGGVLDIHQQILFRLESMTKVDGTLGEGGKFYCVLRSCRIGLEETEVTVGLAFSCSELIPIFKEGQESGDYQQISPEDCLRWGLPIWAPPYTGPRPSRYKRKPVI